MRTHGIRNRPYALLASFYDDVVPGIAEMNRGARKKMLGATLAQARVVCDLACGSGSTAIELARADQRVFAVDLATRFCAHVRQRARAARLDIEVIRADMRDFRLPEPVDLLLCEFAALNNLDDRAGLADVFACVARALKPGGQFRSRRGRRAPAYGWRTARHGYLLPGAPAATRPLSRLVSQRAARQRKSPSSTNAPQVPAQARPA